MDAQCITVCLRIRPSNALERDLKCKDIWTSTKNSVSERLENGVQGATYTYDHVFASGTPTLELHNRMVVPILGSLLEGFNGSLFAYGQTSSGKTYTLLGTHGSVGSASSLSSVCHSDTMCLHDACDINHNRRNIGTGVSTAHTVRSSHE